MISVIIPVYNGEKYIEKSIMSVINQNYKCVEIIVVNDGSDDRTLDILNSIWEKYNPVGEIISISNGGLANARNVGIKRANGKYICNLDADDFLEKNIFELIYREYKNEDFDICYYGYRDIDENRKIKLDYSDYFKYKNNLDGREGLLSKLERTIWICQGSAIYKKELIERYQLFNIPGINQGEDFYFICLMLAKSKKIKCIEAVGVNILISTNSMMHQKYNNTYKQSIIAAQNLYKRITSFKEYEKDIQILSLIKIHIMEQACHVAKRMISSREYNTKELISMFAEVKVPEFEELEKVRTYMSKKKYLQLKIFKTSSLFFVYMARVFYRFKEVK